MSVATQAAIAESLNEALVRAVTLTVNHTLLGVVGAVRDFAEQEAAAAWEDRWAFSEHSYTAHQLNQLADGLEELCRPQHDRNT